MKVIDDVVVDTGAVGIIISLDVVDEIGIYAELNHKIMEYYGVLWSIMVLAVVHILHLLKV